MALGAIACAGGSGPSEEAKTRAVAASIVGGHLDTTTNGVVALARAAHGQVGVICSGSLLAPNLVLTARHCVSQIGDGSSSAVLCGTSQFTAKYDPRQLFISTDTQPQGDSTLYSIKEVREAPGSSDVCGFDLALLILKGSGIAATEATPIEPVLDHAPGVKQAFAAVGYGLQDPNDEYSSGTRMRFDKSSVTCVGSKCPRLYDTEDDEWVGKSPVCSGDSGGPALDADGRVFGVTSRGDDQCTYAVYSNVADWADFVRSTALAAATSGSYEPASWVTDMGTATGGTGGTANGGSGGTATGGAGTATPPEGPVGPTVDPLGSSCTGDCPSDYKCYSATGTPPGICVPVCSASNDTCPTRYACSESLGVCTPTQSTTKTAHISGSCAVSPGAESAGGGSVIALLGMALSWLGRRRRRVA